MLRRKLVILIFIVSTMNFAKEPVMAVTDEIKFSREEEKIKNNELYSTIYRLCFEQETKITELQKLLHFANSINDISFVGAEDQRELKWSNFIIVRDIVRDAVNDIKLTEGESDSLISQLKYYIEELHII